MCLDSTAVYELLKFLLGTNVAFLKMPRGICAKPLPINPDAVPLHTEGGLLCFTGLCLLNLRGKIIVPDPMPFRVAQQKFLLT